MFFIIKWFFVEVYDHYAGLMTGFEPLVRVHDFSRIPTLKDWRKLASRYRLACLVIGSAMAEFFIKCFYYKTFRLPEESNPFFRIITRVWPASLEQRDWICFGGYTMCTLYYFNLLFDKGAHYEWFMYYTVDKKNVVISAGKALPTTLASNLLTFWFRLRPRVSLLQILIVINTNLTTTVIFYIGEAFFPSPATGGFWNTIFLFVAPVYMTYLSYVVIYSCIFWVHLKILIIKQEYYIRWFNKLIGRLSDKKEKTGSEKGSEKARTGSTKKALRDYFVNVKTLISLMSEIRSFNLYWSKYLTIVLTIFSMEICYVTFAIVTAPTMEKKLQFAPLGVYPITFSLYIYLISSTCSRIVINNKLIHRGIRQFNFRCGTASIYYRLKMESFDCFQKFFAKSAFRTLNNYIIDLKLFEMLAFWIIFFSMKLFGRKLAAYF